MQVTDICRMNISTFLLVFSKPMFILLTRVYWLTGRLNHLLLWMTIDRQKCNALCHYEKKSRGKKKILWPARLEGGKTLLSIQQPAGSLWHYHEFFYECWEVKTNLIVKDIYLKMNYCWPGKSCVEAEIIECAFFYPHVCTPTKEAIHVTQVTSVWQRVRTSLTDKLLYP